MQLQGRNELRGARHNFTIMFWSMPSSRNKMRKVRSEIRQASVSNQVTSERGFAVETSRELGLGKCLFLMKSSAFVRSNSVVLLLRP